ncbi:MAG TPA: hypothetical protein VNZ61_21020 [Roseomonas sp.]|nr:hypothetical protein [Roseomonas sp.]
MQTNSVRRPTLPSQLQSTQCVMLCPTTTFFRCSSCTEPFWTSTAAKNHTCSRKLAEGVTTALRTGSYSSVGLSVLRLNFGSGKTAARWMKQRVGLRGEFADGLAPRTSSKVAPAEAQNCMTLSSDGVRKPPREVIEWTRSSTAF